MTATLPAALLLRAAGLAACLPHAAVLLSCRPALLCLHASTPGARIDVAVPARTLGDPWQERVAPGTIATKLEMLLAQGPTRSRVSVAHSTSGLSLAIDTSACTDLPRPSAVANASQALPAAPPPPPATTLRLPAHALSEAVRHVRLVIESESAPCPKQLQQLSPAALRFQSASAQHLCRADITCSHPQPAVPPRSIPAHSLYVLSQLARMTAAEDDILLHANLATLHVWLPQPPRTCSPCPLLHAILPMRNAFVMQPPVPERLPLALRLPLPPLLRATLALPPPPPAMRNRPPCVDLYVQDGHAMLRPAIAATGRDVPELHFPAPDCQPATLRLPLRPLLPILSTMSAPHLTLETDPRAPHRALLRMPGAAAITHLLLLPAQPAAIPA